MKNLLATIYDVWVAQSIPDVHEETLHVPSPPTNMVHTCCGDWETFVDDSGSEESSEQHPVPASSAPEMTHPILLQFDELCQEPHQPIAPTISGDH